MSGLSLPLSSILPIVIGNKHSQQTSVMGFINCPLHLLPLLSTSSALVGVTIIYSANNLKSMIV